MLLQGLLVSWLTISGASAASIRLDRLERSVQTGQPDSAPSGYEQYISQLTVPSPNITGAGGWEQALSKAKNFVSQLTLEELVNMTTGADVLQRCVGNTGSVPRLGQRSLCLEDSPLGVRFADFVSAFPAGITTAATFDKQLAYKRGYAMGVEHKGKGVDVALGPMMNLLRAPEAGRLWEGFHADPFGSGVFAAETVKGMQDAGVMACAKHYIGNEQEHFRGGSGANASSSNIDDRTIHELYLWPFAESVRAGVASVMCSYQRINQTHACENSKALNGLLKEELDFQGFVMSDWGAITQGVSSVLAGTDMNMPGFVGYTTGGNQPDPSTANNSYWGAALVEMVNNGSVPLHRLQDMVTRIMTPYYLFNHDSYDYPNVSFSQLGQTTYIDGQGLVNLHVDVQHDHYKLIREIGAASSVLLKNTNNTLPLDASSLRRIGIFGSDAGPNYDGPNGCSDRGCDQGTLAMGWGSGTANFPYLVDPLAGISSYVRSVKPNMVIEGVLNDTNYKAIQLVAPVADVCLTFVNSDSGEGYITVDGNEGDRNNLTLWHNGDDLIKNVTGSCSNTVVVIHSVGPVDVESFADNPNVTAIIWAGLPGQESGNAITDVLFGAVNPSGRLPFTIAKNRTDYPADVLYESNEPIVNGTTIPQIDYSEQLQIDYRHFDAKNITPRYEFGYGLSYTQFEYDSLSISSSYEKRDMNQLWSTGSDQNIKAPGGNTYLYDEMYSVSVQIKNTGGRDGYEVPQMYLGFPDSAGEPPKILRGFERVWVPQGGCETVCFKINRKELSYWDVVKQRWIMPQGEFKVYVGKSSRDIQLEGSFNVQ